jgi:hypothetical protein
VKPNKLLKAHKLAVLVAAALLTVDAVAPSSAAAQ